MFDQKSLYKKLIDEGILKSNHVKEAFLANDRKKFVTEKNKKLAYHDSALPLVDGQTISQPTTAIFMLELLNPKPGNKILDIGAGSGWVSAMLAYICGKKGKVWAMEINEKVAELGRANLKKYNYRNLNYLEKDYQEVLGKIPKLDRIISGASFQKEEEYLVLMEKLKIGGRMVIATYQNDVRLIVKKEKNDYKETVYPGFVFVSIVH